MGWFDGKLGKGIAGIAKRNAARKKKKRSEKTGDSVYDSVMAINRANKKKWAAAKKRRNKKKDD